MHNVTLLGKKYNDTILDTGKVILGETNECMGLRCQNGGIYNFLALEPKDVKFTATPCGEKSAYIISDSPNSQRTSFVLNITPSTLLDIDLYCANKVADRVHVAYLDDFEDLEGLLHITSPMSVDFCTTNSRENYLDILEKCDVAFDSRERKHLYENININSHLILHDEFGFEILKNGKCVHQESMEPLDNLHVNGAGDTFAAFFIENFFSHDIIKSSHIAMTSTTQFLIEREDRINEKI